ncbi:MAG: hypothetical protein RBR59_02485 [Sulfurimonadaceae bacterium]|nr:hypothetical protein [Sulfurimonadaceae bacterium]
MRLPKGFGKNYFRLSAITATTNQISLQANTSRVESFHLSLGFDRQEEEELEEELDILSCPILLNTKASHCNCYYFKITRKALRLHSNQNYFFNYFKSLNNAISPP